MSELVSDNQQQCKDPSWNWIPLIKAILEMQEHNGWTDVETLDRTVEQLHKSYIQGEMTLTLEPQSGLTDLRWNDQVKLNANICRDTVRLRFHRYTSTCHWLWENGVKLPVVFV